MSDRKPVIIAVGVGALALAANGAAAVVAISASNAPPEAATFGIIGLAAAFVGFLITILWAFQDEAPPIRHERIFTPWSERAEDEFAPRIDYKGRSPLALAARAAPASAPQVATAPAIAPAPADDENRVIYIAEWLKARGIQPADA